MHGTRRILILFLVTCAACAQIGTASPPDGGLLIWQPPTLEFPDTAPQATVPKEMITALRLAKMPIILEETRLDDLQKQLGGTVGHSGDASESLAWLCYCGEDETGRWALWLESSEMGGGERVDGFGLQRIRQNATVDRRCRTLHKDAGRIELPIALRLGLTETQLGKILGRPSVKYHDTLIFEHEHKEIIRNEPFTAINTVAIALRGGAVWAIQVWKDTSN